MTMPRARQISRSRLHSSRAARYSLAPKILRKSGLRTEIRIKNSAAAPTDIEALRCAGWLTEAGCSRLQADSLRVSAFVPPHHAISCSASWVHSSTAAVNRRGGRAAVATARTQDVVGAANRIDHGRTPRPLTYRILCQRAPSKYAAPLRPAISSTLPLAARESPGRMPSGSTTCSTPSLLKIQNPEPDVAHTLPW